MTKSTGFYRYMDSNCSLMSTGRRMYCIWKWSFRPRAGQISCFGVILAKISRRTCDRDSHLFQATICGGVQGHARDQCHSRDWVLFPVIFGGKGLLTVRTVRTVNTKKYKGPIIYTKFRQHLLKSSSNPRLNHEYRLFKRCFTITVFRQCLITD